MCLQLWLGDFNALTREDYTQKQWEAIAAERSKSYWEEPRTEVSQRISRKIFWPFHLFKLMDQLRARGLSDSWASVGRPGKVSTCRCPYHLFEIFSSDSTPTSTTSWWTRPLWKAGFAPVSIILLQRHRTTLLLLQHIKENRQVWFLSIVSIVSLISKRCLQFFGYFKNVLELALSHEPNFPLRLYLLRQYIY